MMIKRALNKVLPPHSGILKFGGGTYVPEGQKYPLPVPLPSCLSKMAFLNSPEWIYIFYLVEFCKKIFIITKKASPRPAGMIYSDLFTNCLTMKGMQRLLIIYSFRSDC